MPTLPSSCPSTAPVAPQCRTLWWESPQPERTGANVEAPIAPSADRWWSWNSLVRLSVLWQSQAVSEVIMRTCRDLGDLVAIYEAIGRQFGEIWSGDDRRLAEPRLRFDADRELMTAVVEGDCVRGGVIAFGGDTVTVRAIGVDQELRGRGIGRRLLEVVEARALVRGARVIGLGAADEARGFYERLGYRGKHTMREKQLPLPGVVRDRLAARARAELIALDRGVVVGGG